MVGQLADHLEDVAVQVHRVPAARVVRRHQVVAVDDQLHHFARVDDEGVGLPVDGRVRRVEARAERRVERRGARRDVGVGALGDAVGGREGGVSKEGVRWGGGGEGVAGVGD